MMKIVRNFGVRAGAILSVLLLVCALGAAMPAAAAPLGQGATGTITGQVISEDNVPLPNVLLAAYSQGPNTANREASKIGEVRSDAQGRYSIQVPAGTITMDFVTQDILGRSFWGYSNLPVDVAAGQTVSGADFRVAIRVVSEAPAVGPAPVAPVAPVTPAPGPAAAPGMPTTGAGAGIWLPLVMALGLLMVGLGVVQRRRAAN